MILLLIILIILCAGISPTSSSQGGYGTGRCPTCGARAGIRGDTRECTECGDFGRVRR